jgi:RND superfamily putative drug exporter
VSREGRTTFLLAYAPPTPGSFGQNQRAVSAVTAALRAVTVAGARVRVTGLDALSASSGQKPGGLGVLAEGLLGGLGALVVLAFVFGSLLAIVPLPPYDRDPEGCWANGHAPGRPSVIHAASNGSVSR